MPYCNHCGAEVSAEARICPTCNRPLGTEAQPSLPETPVPAEPVTPPGSVPPDATQAFPGGYVPRRTDGGAIAALVMGILGIITCPLILSIPAIVVGRSAERRIRASGGTLDGEGLAKAGWITGIVGTVLGVIAILIWIFVLVAFIGFDGNFEPMPFPSFQPVEP